MPTTDQNHPDERLAHQGLLQEGHDGQKPKGKNQGMEIETDSGNVGLGASSRRRAGVSG